MSKYLTHTACDISKVPKRQIPKGETVEEMVQTYLVQMKYDGVCAILIYDPDNLFGGTRMLTRTGESITSCDHVAQALTIFPFDLACGMLAEDRKKLEDDGSLLVAPLAEQCKAGVYIGELWHPTLGQSTISGAVRRHEATDDSRALQFVVCDFVTHAEWNLGIAKVGFCDRVERIAWMQQIGNPMENSKYVQPPIWFAGYEGMVLEMEATSISALAKQAVDSGAYDGVVLRHQLGWWERGQRDASCIKVKPSLTVDVRVTGMVEGKGKYKGVLGALICDYNGKELQLSGMTDQQRVDWWEKPSLITGKVVEVEAMSESTHGSLREPRFKGIRFDSAPESEK